MKRVICVFSIALVFLYMVVSANIVQAKTWKPYDDFEKGFSFSDAKPADAKLPFGKNWIRFIPEDRLKMDVKDGKLWFDVTAAGTRDPGFKLAFGWEPKDIAGIQFTVKVAELSDAGGWFGILCTDEETDWLQNNWIFGMSPNHQHSWGPKTVFGAGSAGKLGGWIGFSYEDIPENTNMLRVIRAEWNSGAKEMTMTIDPGSKTQWSTNVPSNADLAKFPWWTIYITCDQVVTTAIDDVYVLSESLPYSIESNGKLANTWGNIKDEQERKQN